MAGRQERESVMLRRALIVTAVAVALSAAGAFAFVPRLARVGHGFSLGALWSGHGFTPIPRSRDSVSSSDELLLQTQGGAPGTYCPIRPRDDGTSAAAHDQHTSTVLPLDSAASSPAQTKVDLLQPPPAANCTVPTGSAPASRTVVP